ncbi:MAG TPA: hypothetical protein VD965_07570 [Burkholderiales bacterium]|nr:hypothetical protein [Burkholderiales bacterium]
MPKTKKQRDEFPREVFVQHLVEKNDEERTVMLTVDKEEAEVFDQDLCHSDFDAGERVGVYKLVGVVKLNKRTTITRQKAR